MANEGSCSKHILFVDDEMLPSQYYRLSLEESNFKVKFCPSVDEALDFVEKNPNDLSVAIVDIMMPPGKAYGHRDTHDGIHTGIFFLRDLKRLCPHIVIFILTNISDKSIFSSIKSEFRDAIILQKIQYSPSSLAETIIRALSDNPVNF